MMHANTQALLGWHLLLTQSALFTTALVPYYTALNRDFVLHSFLLNQVAALLNQLQKACNVTRPVIQNLCSIFLGHKCHNASRPVDLRN
mmetsp:Transcript_4804/g.17027  ORF Transcript_4804/g.17027 Transcript_4804/m.17027 type:complete len:89 (-) Transcript_4804:1373-1639(-)